MNDPYGVEPKQPTAAFASSDQINELAGALAKAQGELGRAVKNATNPHFRSDYADLTAHLEAALPTLSKHELALMQLPGYDGEWITVTTVLAHSSGQWISTRLGLKQEKGGPHELGSLTTYLRRYGLGIYGASQADDDANEASGKPAPSGAQPKQHDPTQVMPMGKHAGKPYSELPNDYLEWAVQKMADGVPKQKCQEELAKRKQAA